MGPLLGEFNQDMHQKEFSHKVIYLQQIRRSWGVISRVVAAPAGDIGIVVVGGNEYRRWDVLSSFVGLAPCSHRSSSGACSDAGCLFR